MAIEIEAWEIWHTYTTFLESTHVDLLDSAYRLVASGIAECAMLQDGQTFWKSTSSVQTGTTTIEVEPTSGISRFQLKLKEGCAKPEGFALEAWGLASYFLVSERKVLGDDTALPPPYLRAYLGKCVATSTSKDEEVSEVNLYPVLIVYESGVLMVEFRTIGPENVTKLADFIAGGVNLFQHRFDRVEVNPGLAKFATRAYYRSGQRWNIVNRAKLIWLQAGHDLAVKQRTQRQSDNDFSFDLVPWSGEDKESLSSIATTIFHTTAFLIGHPKAGVAFLFWGEAPAPVLGEFWSGRPHIHLVRFSEQCETATQNEARHGPDFVRILCRVPPPHEIVRGFVLPKDARLFEDYNAYVTSTSTLWVWSQRGLKSQESWMDPNRGNLIYERQVLVELLEYGYMLHRSLYHRVRSFGTTDKVLAVRREILELRLKMREASHSGEISELLENGWKEFGLPDLAKDIETALSLRGSETRSLEVLRSTRVGWALTILFGLVAVPTLADQLIEPLWKLSGLRQFSDESLVKVVSGGIAVLVVLLILWLTLFVLCPREGAPK
jgi:hypothetical protein